MAEQRERMTCARCWEREGRNVKLHEAATKDAARSVETLLSYECPECGHSTGWLAT